MSNTYDDEAAFEIKVYEELRCTRCVLERILRVMDEGLFVDYQMEKFGKDYRTPCKHTEAKNRLKRQKWREEHGYPVDK